MAPPDAAASQIAYYREPPPPGSPYGVPVPGSERPNRSAVYRHYRLRDKPMVSTFDPEIQTMHDVFESSVRRFPKNRCLGYRAWNASTQSWGPSFDWISYAEVNRRRNNFGAGIVELHKAIGHPKDKFGVGLWSQNRPEWQITDLALASQSLYTVSLYETLGPETTEYITNHAELACIVCSLPHVPTLLKVAPRAPGLKIIISLDPLDAGEQQGYSKASVLNAMAAEHGIKIYSMAEVESIGERSGRPVRPPNREDLCTINYTSGTTGMPKGVLLTHRSAVAANCAGRVGGTFSDKDCHLSYLPLAHIYGRLMDNVALAEGAGIGFFRGDILGLVDDLKILQPTGFISVPRLFNRFNSAIRAATVEAPGFRGTLSRRVIETKKAQMKAPNGQASNKHFFYDRFWTPKVRAAVGLNKVRAMVSGSAQLDPDVQEFLLAAFGAEFHQGWGMTETYATGSVQMQNDFSTGNIGSPMIGSEICLESVPEFEYTVNDKPNPRGEMLIRGPIMFSGYYKNDEENKKTIEADGWFHTGDICEIDPLGRIKIIDRKKNVLKLAQGEYISPERIENVFLGSTAVINSAYVHGSPKQSSLVAVFGIDPENFPAFVKKVSGRDVSPTDRDGLLAAARDPKVKDAFVKLLADIARNHKFNSHERVRNAYLDIDPFTVENELITPTLKLKRPQVARAYADVITKMYEELASQAPKGKL